MAFIFILNSDIPHTVVLLFVYYYDKEKKIQDCKLTEIGLQLVLFLSTHC
jgi:hypothetical protein